MKIAFIKGIPVLMLSLKDNKYYGYSYRICTECPFFRENYQGCQWNSLICSSLFSGEFLVRI